MYRYAVLADLSSMRLTYAMFAETLAALEREGSVEYVKFYNYSPKRNGEYSQFIKERGAEVDLPMQSKKKVRVDMRQVIDAVRIASCNGNVDAFFLIASEVDCIYLVNALKKMGKRVEMGVPSPNSVSGKCHREYVLERVMPAEEVARPVSRAVEPVEIMSAEANDVVERINKTSKVMGSEDAFLPYTDIESDSKMAEIDRRLIEMIRSSKETAKRKVAGEAMDGDDKLEELLKKYFD